MVQSDDRLLFSAKRNELLSYEKTWRKLICIFLSERTQSENTTYGYDFNYMSLWKMQNYEYNKRQWLPGVGGREELTGRTQRNFRAGKLLCTILLGWSKSAFGF